MSQTTVRKPGELFFCWLMLGVSSLLFWQAYGIAQFSTLSSPGAVPLATSAIMIISCCIVLAKTWPLAIDDQVIFGRHILPPLVGTMMALILIYALLLESLGFLIASAGFLFIGFSLLHRSRTGLSLLLTAVCLAVIYIIFRLFFKVILPEGLIPEREIHATISQLFTQYWR